MRANHVLKPLDYSLAALILFGLCNTFQFVFHGLTVDFDVSRIPLFWQDIHHYGWGFLATVRSASDKFQFSLTPLYFFLFWMFDIKPTIVILSGWAIFIDGAMATAATAYLATKNLRTALVIAAVIMFPAPLIKRRHGLPGLSHRPRHLHGLWIIRRLIYHFFTARRPCGLVVPC